jgi:putative restriction endonuclease
MKWAGEFAFALAKTTTFESYWTAHEPLWILAGFCWGARNPERPSPDPLDPTEYGTFTEGEQKRRLHLLRERNPALVRAAKELRMRIDPELHCEVCGFSYIKFYGERGAEFIEAHHRVPLSKLTSTTKSRVEDLALVCANCHRMLHREPFVDVEGLRAHIRPHVEE